MLAAYLGSIDVVLELLTANADVNLEDNVCLAKHSTYNIILSLLLFSLEKLLSSML